MLKTRYFVAVSLALFGFVLAASFQNCQKKEENTETVAKSNPKPPRNGDDEIDEEPDPTPGPANTFCVSGGQPATCTPAGGGKAASANYGVWGFVERVALVSEGRPIHAALQTNLPILYGWAFDDDFKSTVKKQLSINLYLNGTFCRSLVANISRGDLKLHPAYPGDPPNYGWGVAIDGLPRGTYMVNAFALDPNTCTPVALTNNGYSLVVP